MQGPALSRFHNWLKRPPQQLTMQPLPMMTSWRLRHCLRALLVMPRLRHYRVVLLRPLVLGRGWHCRGRMCRRSSSSSSSRDLCRRSRHRRRRRRRRHSRRTMLHWTRPPILSRYHNQQRPRPSRSSPPPLQRRAARSIVSFLGGDCPASQPRRAPAQTRRVFLLRCLLLQQPLLRPC